MPRIARVVAPGFPHHITQRGNGRQDVFRCDEDRRLYLQLYLEFAARFRLVTWGFCLMSNHVHLLGVPEREESLAKTLGRTHSAYARYFNLRYGKCGHLWEARYFSCPLEGDHVWAALRYVERNPVQAGMVREAGAWRWSSARAHIAGLDPDGFLTMGPWREVYDCETWREQLGGQPRDEVSQRELRGATLCGRPLGSKEFVERLEREMGRRLTPRAPGRPRKEDREAGAQLEIGN